ncbi:MAG: SHOCT domain-containing protein [Chloroflexi bacterium]|nr:SHOCT domain-containing protein [Chloroflexota bacterium]MBI5349575.1 SHOCT domain-containing protein [Chloroflexota bacterium]
MGLKEAMEYVEQIGRRGVVRITEEGTSASAGAKNESQVTKLRELKQMLDEGLITSEDYEAKKREILSDM